MWKQFFTVLLNFGKYFHFFIQEESPQISLVVCDMVIEEMWSAG